ncbi:MAG: carbohydrate kinase family protein [Chloroflexi bacterium]|nr:carbohydrate kinase family protein [Chloroflexota bacterium]
MSRIMVAGHLCLDLIPDVQMIPINDFARAGQLHEVGPMAIALGGAVANTGLALHILGSDVGLIGLCGTDAIGALVVNQIAAYHPRLIETLVRTDSVATSYSIVVTPGGQDRSFFYFPGTTAALTAQHIMATLDGATWLHIGYPPLLRALMVNDASPLIDTLRYAHDYAITTSIDMVVPDPHAISGQYNWLDLLPRILAHVDVFVPSAAEICAMLRPADYARWGHACDQHIDEAYAQTLCAELIDMGVAVAGMKLGVRGLYLCTAGAQRLSRARLSVELANQRVWQASYPVAVKGTVGAGDACYAGLIAALIGHQSLPIIAQVGCAVAACCVEEVDAVRGIQSLDATRRRFGIEWY